MTATIYHATTQQPQEFLVFVNDQGRFCVRCPNNYHVSDIIVIPGAPVVISAASHDQGGAVKPLTCKVERQ